MKKLILIIGFICLINNLYANNYLNGDCTFIEDITWSKIDIQDSIVTIEYVTNNNEYYYNIYYYSEKLTPIILFSRVFIIQIKANTCIEIETINEKEIKYEVQKASKESSSKNC